MKKDQRLFRKLVKLAGGQVEAAELLGVGQASISRYVRGQEPGSRAIAKLATVVVAELEREDRNNGSVS